jgi:threonine dehydrogenase-like Zn-dependent dehydrogenase
VIEAIGLPLTFRAAVEEVAFTGRVVYIGYAKKPVAYETRLFVQKELDILGSRNALPEDFRAVIRMLEAGGFPVEDAVSATIDPEQAAEMLAEWSAHPGRFNLPAGHGLDRTPERQHSAGLSAAGSGLHGGRDVFLPGTTSV